MDFLYIGYGSRGFRFRAGREIYVRRFMAGESLDSFVAQTGITFAGNQLCGIGHVM